MSGKDVLGEEEGGGAGRNSEEQGGAGRGARRSKEEAQERLYGGI